MGHKFTPNYRLTDNIVNYIAGITADREAILRSPILPAIEDNLRKEALLSRTHSSTAIEGNPLSYEQVKVIVDKGKIVARPKDRQEIENYVKALQFLDKIARHKEITPAVILNIQRLTSRKILPKKDSGKYRDRMVYVVDKFGRTVFTPPLAASVPGLVAGLAAWLNGVPSHKIHPVLVAGMAHYELVRIHPFIDGNGRTARALATLVLYQRGFDIKHFFALDDYYNHDREAYYAALQYVDPNTRDLTQWLGYFVEGVAAQMNKLRKKVESLAHEPVFKKMKGRIILKERQWKLLEYLKEKGRASNLEYQKLADISREMAKRDLALLVKEGVLKKSGRGRGVHYFIFPKTRPSF